MRLDGYANVLIRSRSILMRHLTSALFWVALCVLAACGTAKLRFTEMSAEAGVAFHHHKPNRSMTLGGGTVVFDFDNDGLQDIYVSDSNGPNALYRNNGDGTFTDAAAAAGVADPGGEGNGGCAADYDNDGDRDLYVTNYGPSRLFRNTGTGRFEEVARQSGVHDGDAYYRSMGCAWGDYDGDGLLDVVVARHLHEWNPDLFRDKDFVSAVGGMALYHNEGGGLFEDVTALLGDTSAPREGPGVTLGNVWGAGFQPAWLDYDNDGDLDLYVVNDFGVEVQPNVLWRNDGPAPDGGWSFRDVSWDSRADVAVYGMGLAVGDYNRDGSLDLFVTNIKDNVLLRNNADGLTFSNASREAGAGVGMIGRKLRVAWGTAFLDYDNDGFEDIYIVSGFLEGSEVGANPEEQSNVLLRNAGDGTFEDVSAESGTDDPGAGRGGSYLDFDNDGCLDIYVVNLDGAAKLFENPCRWGSNWLVVEPVGVVSNRDGIGARITVTTGAVSQVREISGGSSSMGQNMLPAHFGLGEFGQADSVSVRWPSGKLQTLTDVSANQRLTIREPG